MKQMEAVSQRGGVGPSLEGATGEGGRVRIPGLGGKGGRVT